MEYISLSKSAKNIQGHRFGRWIALGPVSRVKKKVLWLCQCDCGNTSHVRANLLLSGNSRSCGCLSRDLASERLTKHGMKKTNIFNAWSKIIGRCLNPQDDAYDKYGGRGITICNEWLGNFMAFYDHVSALPHYGEKGYTLDRINNDGNYEQGNVRWATWLQQARNKRNNHLLTLDGKTQCIAAWAEEIGIRSATICYRVNKGWSTERVLRTPLQNGKYGDKAACAMASIKGQEESTYEEYPLDTATQNN